MPRYVGFDKCWTHVRVAEGFFATWREGKRQVYAPRSLDWLMSACELDCIIKYPVGRPRGFDDPRKDLLLLWERFSTSEVEYLRGKGFRFKQVKLKGGRIRHLLVGYGAKTKPDIEEVINRRQWQKLVSREKRRIGLK